MLRNLHFSFLKKLSLSLLLMGVLFLLCLAALFFVADMVFEDKNMMFDENIFEKIKPFVNQTNTNIMLVITFLGSQKFLVPANLLLIFYFFLVKDNKKTALQITAISLTSVIVMFSIKFFLQRQRPMIPLISKVHGYSFPSGHTFSSVTFFGILAYMAYRNIKQPLLRWAIIIILIIFVILIGFSRVYLRLHYASDVIAGFCLGTLWLILAEWFLLNTEQTPLQQNL
ncbi:MAG: phosphatase PAP2 family protein [Ferruginibacter sp.]